MRSGLSANGTSQAANSHNMMPKAYMSVAGDFDSPLKSSGAENARVATFAKLPTLDTEATVLST